MKNIYTRSILAFCLLAGLSSITHAEPAKETPATQADLTATKEWRLSQIGEKAVGAGSGITLVFNDKGHITGSGGVNQYGSEYQCKADGQIIVQNIFATEKAALDENLMNQESQFLRLLGKAKRAILSGENLIIECEDADNKKVNLVFVKAKKE
jgi:heat shock protein HslJ